MLRPVRLWRLLVAPLAPRLCLSCRGAAGAAEPLCSACRPGLRWLGPARLPVSPSLSAWAPVAYEGPARDVVHAFKFGRRAALADALAAHIVARAPAGLLEGTLVPVPLHPARGRSRGFNQARLLADAVARRTGLPVADCLARCGDAAPQARRRRADRMAAAAGRGIAVVPALVPARTVLVDDVVTTGATLAECGRALLAAGARDVSAVAWARTPAR